jgi:hypothetical protein
VHDSKHKFEWFWEYDADQMIPETRRILTREMATTALAAVRRNTRTACLNNDEVCISGVFIDVREYIGKVMLCLLKSVHPSHL